MLGNNTHVPIAARKQQKTLVGVSLAHRSQLGQQAFLFLDGGHRTIMQNDGIPAKPTALLAEHQSLDAIRLMESARKAVRPDVAAQDDRQKTTQQHPLRCNRQRR